MVMRVCERQNETFTFFHGGAIRTYHFFTCRIYCVNNRERKTKTAVSGAKEGEIQAQAVFLKSCATAQLLNLLFHGGAFIIYNTFL